MNSFEIHQGEQESRIILHVPHSARHIPVDVRQDLLLDDVNLEHELNEMTDTLTDAIAFAAVEKTKNFIPAPTIFRNTMSRLVIDPERFPDERETMNKIGMGAVYHKCSSGLTLRSDDFNDSELLRKYFYPYAEEFTNVVDDRMLSHESVVIIDVHSYRYQQHSNSLNYGQRRPSMCIGTDRFHTPQKLFDIFRDEFDKNGDCFENEPYAGTYVPMKHYGKNKAVQSIMMETRADTFLTERLEPHEGFNRVTDALASVLRRVHDAGRL